MGQALYRKYRPKTIDEVVGQEHITAALKQALAGNRLSHAYLFTGPRGVGKTSVARILAHEVNGLPYVDDAAHLDIIEIDAASNRRIDEIRELRDKVYVAPTSATYKVYIIDEVHMLTREAFNALLKTLEEPPAHVIFILATTDAHKVPATIVSRTQRYSFKPVEPTKIVAHLQQIATAEKLTIDDAALTLIAAHSEGGLRDSLSLLDQVSNQLGEVSEADVRVMLGIAPVESLTQLITLLPSSAASTVLQTLTALYEQGYQPAAIAKQLSDLLRQQLSDNQLSFERSKVLGLLTNLLEVPTARDPERMLEIVLLGVNTSQPPMQPVEPVQADKPTPKAIIPAEPTKVTKPAVAAAKARPASKQSSAAVSALDMAVWPQILANLKQHYNTLYGIVRMAQPDFSEAGRLTLTFTFAFHQKRINDAKNKQIVADAVSTVTGQQLEIRCLVDKDSKPGAAITPVKAASAAQDPSLQTINDIFGGGEVL